MIFIKRIVIFVGLWVWLIGCKGSPDASESLIIVNEVDVITIPFEGDITSRSAEISGLTWYGDTLIILPQYPEIFPTEVGGSLFSFSKKDILNYLAGNSTDAIAPQVIPFDDSGLGENIPGFEGFEAIGFFGERGFLTIEAEMSKGMMGYIVSGEIQPDSSAFHLNANSLQEIHPQSELDNFTDESVLIFDDQILTFYEANGANVNHQPVGHGFDFDLNPTEDVAFPTIEYRITDVTTLDDENRFWAINYHFSGEAKKLDPAPDSLVLEYGQGASHAESKHVERLVEFQYTSDGIIRTARPPIQLHLLDNGKARNWEGIVRLDDLGFLLMTDKHPGTILGFVPFP